MNTKKIKFLNFVIQVKIISELGEKKHFFGTQKKQIQQSNADWIVACSHKMCKTYC